MPQGIKFMYTTRTNYHIIIKMMFGQAQTVVQPGTILTIYKWWQCLLFGNVWHSLLIDLSTLYFMNSSFLYLLRRFFWVFFNFETEIEFDHQLCNWLFFTHKTSLTWSLSYCGSACNKTENWVVIYVSGRITVT